LRLRAFDTGPWVSGSHAVEQSSGEGGQSALVSYSLMSQLRTEHDGSVDLGGSRNQKICVSSQSHRCAHTAPGPREPRPESRARRTECPYRDPRLDSKTSGQLRSG